MAQLVYNPTLIDKEELQQMLVGREALLEDLLKKVSESSGKKTFTNYILIGQRGIGKTHLLLLLYYAVKEDPELSQRWIPVRFNEEEYSISNIGDFLLRIVEELSKDTGDSEAKAILDEVGSMSADSLTDRSLSYLHKLRDSGRQIILLIDNFDRILDQLGEIDTAGLRDVLMTDGTILLIGGAPSVFEQIINHGQSFYEFFDIEMLEELDSDEVETLIRKRAELDGRQDLLDQFDDLRPRILATTQLTGGIPRLILMVYRIFAESEFIEAKEALQELLDELTPFYQDRMNRLASQQRKIMDTMAMLNGPTSPTALARKSGIGVRQVTTQLGRLRDLGYVRQIPSPHRKRSAWEITERIFRIWREMRITTDNRRIPFFLTFLKIWLTSPSISREVESIVKRLHDAIDLDDKTSMKNLDEYCSYLQKVSSPSEAVEIILARIRIFSRKGANAPTHSDIIDFFQDLTIFKDHVTTDYDPRLYALSLLLLVHSAWGLKQFDTAWRISEELMTRTELTHTERGDILFLRGSVHFLNKDFEKAREALLLASKLHPEEKRTHLGLGGCSFGLGKYEDATQAFIRSTEIDPEFVPGWICLGVCYRKTLNFSAAKKAFENAVMLAPNYSIPNLDLASVIAVQGKLEGNQLSLFLKYLKNGLTGNTPKGEEEDFQMSIRALGMAIAYALSPADRAMSFELNLNSHQLIWELFENLSEDVHYTLLRSMFFNLLCHKRFDDIEDLFRKINDKDWRWKDDKEVFEPFRIATDVLVAEDTSLLSNQAEEMREIVESIINSVESRSKAFT